MNYNLQQYYRYIYIDISPSLSGTTRGPGAAEMPRPGKEPALTGSVSWLGEEAGGCVMVRSRSSVARAPPVGRAYLQDRSGRERTGAVLPSASLRAARARTSATSLHSGFSTARRADSYEKVVRLFTDIIGES